MRSSTSGWVLKLNSPCDLGMTMEMYRLHSERILNLEYRTVRERVVSFLLTTAQRFGTQTARGIRIDVPLRHQDIASSINATRETTTRELAYLERKGLIGKDGSLFLLYSYEALEAQLMPTAAKSTSS